MGAPLLQAHVQTLRQRLETLPGPAWVQRLDVEDNVVELRLAPADATSMRGRRLNYLVYDVDTYPDGSGVMMSEDDADEVLVDTINAQLEGSGAGSARGVAQVLRIVCHAMGINDEAMLRCLDTTGLEAGNVTESNQDSDNDIAFEDDDEDGTLSSFNLDVGSVADREKRPAWKKMRWQETEELRIARQREAQAKTEVEQAPEHKRRRGGATGGGMTLEEQKAAGEQMWSSQEAFSILANELYQLQTMAEAEATPTVEADALDYDVHRWTVRLRTCSGDLGRDMHELKRLFGYDYIELLLAFKEDLHPFYPPTASIVRPRLHGQHDVLSALACHPRLQLRGWSPFQSAKDMLLSMRRFLECNARVDLTNERNDASRFPGGAFSTLERQLAQLGSLCELVPLDLRLDSPANPYQSDPWAQQEELTQSSLGAMLARRRSQKQQTAAAAAAAATPGKGDKKQQRPQFWAAGTGYGHDDTPFVDNTGGAWDPEAMRAAEAAQDEELQHLLRSISNSVKTNQNQSERGQQGEERTEDKLLADLLQKSCLVPFLMRELSTSYMSMGERLAFFDEVFKLVQELLRALPQNAGQLLKPVYTHLLTAKSAARTFLNTLGSSSTRTDVANDVAFAKLVVEIVEEAERLCSSLEEAAQLEWVQQEQVGGSSSSSSAAKSQVDESNYCLHLKPCQLDHCDLESHAYAGEAQAETVAPQARTVRLAKELAGLSTLLPLSGSSSVFVRVHPAKQQLWRALITGPDGTPYGGGCFVFDVYFPPAYPNEPPKVKLLTTGSNSVSFNPNLYRCGKVCLSLLGTWKGDRAESWDPMSSRALQVLVSIQSLILVPDPYFNEPGYEREIGTQKGESKSRQYNMQVREDCVRWAMVDMLKKPLPEFAELIKKHFELRRELIMQEIQAWQEEALSSSSQRALAALTVTLTEELDKLRGREQLSQ